MNNELTTLDTFNSNKEINLFINTLIDIKKELKSNEIINCSNILKKLGYSGLALDSGFESELVETEFSQNEQKSLDFTLILPVSLLYEIIFECNNLDVILENSLLAVCQRLHNFLKDEFELTEDQIKIEEDVEFILRFLTFLSDSHLNERFQDIIELFLKSIFQIAMCSTEETKLEFVMELFNQFSELKQLQTIIFNLIIKNIKIFTESMKVEEIAGTRIFHYENDLKRALTLLMTFFVIKKTIHEEIAYENEEDICFILENFVNQDDFFSLFYLGSKCFLSQ